MAACLVPECPAVLVALEHLLELDKELKSEEVTFRDEASDNLREIAAAITELEESRRDVRERLEVETIETGKLRHKLLRLRDDIANEIAAGVAAARNSNIVLINQLQTDIKSTACNIELMETQQDLLQKQNATLLPERDILKSNHDAAIEELNHCLLEKAKIQISLNETVKKNHTLQEQIINMKTAQEDLKTDIVQLMLTFIEQKRVLEKEIEEAVNKLQEQEKSNAGKCRELERVAAELLNKEEKITEQRNQIGQTERRIVRLRAAEQQCEKQLQEEITKAQHLANQKVFFKKELTEMQESFDRKIKILQEQTVKAEREMEDARAVNELHKQAITKLMARFTVQKREEDETTAAHVHITTQLEKSKLSLEEQTASVAKFKTEIRKMKEELKQLHKNGKITTELWNKNVEHLEKQLNKEEKSREALEAEKHEVCGTLERSQEEQEQRVRKVTNAIEGHKKQHRELQEERNKLVERLLTGPAVEEFRRELQLAEEEFEHMESAFTTEIKELTREAELVQQQLDKEELEMKIQESILKDAESKFEVNQATDQTWRKHIAELESQKTHLDISIEQLKDCTKTLLKPKETLQREIRAVNTQHMELQRAQAAELCAIEKHIYENSVKLEQVNLENSRLHMCIEHMKEDMLSTNRQQERHGRETTRLTEELQSLLEDLLQAWETDFLVTKENTEKDQAVLQAMKHLRSKVHDRKTKIGDIIDMVKAQVEATSALFKSTK